MARFFSRRIRHGDAEYAIELEIDRLAALRRELSVEIRAIKLGPNSQQLTATLTLDPDAHEIIVEIEGEEIGRIPIEAQGIVEANDAEADSVEIDPHDMTPLDTDSIQDDRNEYADRAWAMISEYLEGGDSEGAAIEAIIDSIPAIDPLLGCLLKGGISATAGEIITCYKEIPREVERLRSRLKFVAKCVGGKAWRILARATYKAGRCMVFGGFG